MGRLARKQALDQPDTPPAIAQGAHAHGPRPREAALADAPQASPARLLQDQLSQRLAQPEKPQWSARRTLAFVTVTSGAAWTLIAGAAILALH